MASIQIPDDEFKRLTERAQAAGYADVSAFISALAGEPTKDPRGELSKEQLKQSVAEVEAADASIDAGDYRDAREALLELGLEFGFEIPE